MEKKNIVKRKKTIKSILEPFLITKVNIDLERKLHAHTAMKLKQASVKGDLGEDVVTSFLDDLKSRRTQLTFSRRRNSPIL